MELKKEGKKEAEEKESGREREKKKGGGRKIWQCGMFSFSGLLD